jgi:hypothetical protein
MNRPRFAVTFYLAVPESPVIAHPVAAAVEALRQIYTGEVLSFEVHDRRSGAVETVNLAAQVPHGNSIDRLTDSVTAFLERH